MAAIREAIREAERRALRLLKIIVVVFEMWPVIGTSGVHLGSSARRSGFDSQGGWQFGSSGRRSGLYSQGSSGVSPTTLTGVEGFTGEIWTIPSNW